MWFSMPEPRRAEKNRRVVRKHTNNIRIRIRIVRFFVNYTFKSSLSGHVFQHVEQRISIFQVPSEPWSAALVDADRGVQSVAAHVFEFAVKPDEAARCRRFSKLDLGVFLQSVPVDEDHIPFCQNHDYSVRGETCALRRRPLNRSPRPRPSHLTVCSDWALPRVGNRVKP